MRDTTLDQITINDTVTDSEINTLKQQIAEKKKVLEYQKLKMDLKDIAYRANNELTEFDGGMKQVDTDKVLSTKRGNSNFFEMIIGRLSKMMAVRPVVGSIVGIALTVIGIFIIFQFLHNPKIDPYKIYLAYLLESALVVQILKSSSRSLLLPIFATVFGLIVSNSITEKQLFLEHHQMFYQILMMVGLSGIAISVFTID